MRPIFLLLILSVKLSVQAQDVQYPYYVIVGVFAVESNAIKFTASAQALGHEASYTLNPARKLYYVHVKITDDKQAARDLVLQLRSQREFQGAWIYNGGALMTEAYAKVYPPQDNRQEISDKVNSTVSSGVQPAEDKTEMLVLEVKTEPVAEAPAKKEGKNFVFQLVNSISGEPIKGDVRVVETERDTVYQRYAANEVVYISPPKSGRLIIVCNMVGYKFSKKAIVYDTPAKGVAGATTGSSQEIILPIKLASVKRGDYIDLEKVKFFDNSAIMTPESEEELKELVNLMNSNLKYKIRIHGHTYNDDSREITTPGENKNFFNLSAASKIDKGSAKELCRYRAEAVKGYLVSKGIEASRVSSKGQGAVLVVYEHAAANERVEVEILKH